MMRLYGLSRRAAIGALMLSIATLGACSTNDRPVSEGQARRPNILVIVADDLGYSDIGAFGGEIATPHLDALAGAGRLLTNFHTQAICSPTRASLLSGVDHHLAGLGNMAEVVGGAITSNTPLDAPWGPSNTYDFDNIPAGYHGHLSPNALSMAELLRDGGYHTYMVGKWHLGYEVARPDDKVRTWYRIKPDATPQARGFERSFALMNGGASHFAPTVPPTPLDIVTYAEDARLFPASELPRDFFSTAAFTDTLIGYIEAGRQDGKPFFAYAAYTAPHWPLQAPEADIAAQKGRYDEGYDAIRERRLARMKALGLIPAAMQPHPGVPGPSEGNPGGPRRWHELTLEERAREARLMEVYAAMVANLDAHIGRLVQYLKDIGEYDNTLIVFMSDNGADGAPPYAPPIPGTRMDNALDNIGRPASVVAYGPRWAEVSSTPFRLFKGFAGAEGGTAAPLIVKLPHQLGARPLSDARVHVVDILPTVLEAAGVADPGERHRGRPVHPIEGVSLLSSLSGAGPVASARTDDRVLASELMGNSHVVKGHWKLSRQAPLAAAPVMRGDLPWQLFNLASDRGETTDLAASQPALADELRAAYEAYAARARLVEHARAYSGR